MTDWKVEDFGPSKTGPQFQWWSDRLTIHGIPLNKLYSTLKERTRILQLRLGYTGAGADGLMGPKTLAFLKSDPIVVPPPGKISTKDWKWTGPIGEPGHPDEVYPINGFQVDPWFLQRDGHLIFRSHAGAVTTKNSVHGRSEFREMDGDARAKWATNDGRDHILSGELAITALTPHIPVSVFAQCHDKVDDVFMLAAVGEKEDDERFDVEIWRSLGKDEGNDRDIVLRDVRLNSFFSYQMLFTEAGFFLQINGIPVYEYGGHWLDCYWKAGCYPQTNVKKGEKAAAYSETDYRKLWFDHVA